MRKINAKLTAAILALFLLHGILGAFQLLGAGNVISRVISYTLLTLVAAHALIGIKLTMDTLKVQKSTGAGYFRHNLLFWARRISGFLIMLLIAFHVTAFTDRSSDAIRLVKFDQAKLITQILLVASVALHVITNVKPMLITFGIKGLKAWAADLLFILSVILLFMAAAFIVYYLRWNRM